MKPNPFGFNLNFDEFFGVKFGGARLPKDLTASNGSAGSQA